LKGELLHQLRGHTTAVTCVDWKYMQINNLKKEILATCADDRRVMIWDASKVNHLIIN